MLSLLWNCIIYGFLIYYINNLKPIDWFDFFIPLIYPVYLLFRQEEILLEIRIDQDSTTIRSYSFLYGKKILELPISEIIELDNYGGLLVKYKTRFGKKKETYQISAEPWNNLFSQIKNLKLAVQELEQQKMVHQSPSIS